MTPQRMTPISGALWEEDEAVWGKVHCHLVDLRRGRCFFDTDRMMRVPRPFTGKGELARAVAAAMRALTAG